jgi:O-antigen ligase
VRYRWVLFELVFPRVYRDYTSGLVFMGDVFLIATLLLWGGSWLLNRRPVTLGPRLLAFPMFGLILAGAVSAVFSIVPELSWYYVARLLLAFGLYLYVVNEIRSLMAVLWAVASGVYLQASVSILQALEQGSVGLKLLGELELDPAWKGVSIVWGEGLRSLRAYGLSDHPNILGGVLAFGLLLTLCGYLMAEGGRKLLLAAVFIAGALGLLLTFSRAAWLGFFSGALLAALLLWRRKRPDILRDGLYLAAASLLALAPFIWYNLPYLGVRLNAGRSFEEVDYELGSLVERQALNQAANELFTSNAVNGVGLGASPVALMQSKPDFIFYYQPAHIVVLDAAAETGLFGAMFYAILLSAPWVLMIVRRKRLAFRLDILGASSALLAISLVGFFDYYPWLLMPGRFWQWLLWGLWAAFYRVELERSQDG